MNKIPCEIILDLLPYYADGLLSDVSRALVEEHISECADCRRALDAIRRSRNEEMSGEAENEEAELKYLKKQKKKNKRTRAAGIVLAVAAAVIFAAFAHWMSYPIRPDCSNAGDYIRLVPIRDEYGDGYAPRPVTVYDTVKINDKYCCILFEKNGNLACGRLEAGFSGWYKRPYGSFEGDSIEPYFTVKLIGTGQERYLLFAGRNPEREIVRARVEMEGFSYELDVPEQEAFLRMIPVDSSLGYLPDNAEVMEDGGEFSASESEEEAGSDEKAVSGETVGSSETAGLREWELAETPLIHVFDAVGNDITEKYINVDEEKYNIDPDLGNLQSCIEDFYSRTPYYKEYFALWKDDISIRYVMPLGSRVFVLTKFHDQTDIICLSRSLTGRYCIESITSGNNLSSYQSDYRSMIDCTVYKGRSCMIFACTDCPVSAGRVRFTLFDRLKGEPEIYEIELPEERPEGCCMVAFEAEKKDDTVRQAEDVVFLSA